MKKSTGLIPEAFIERLLLTTDIVDIVGQYVPLKKGGKNYQACCPFHEEKTPSFTVSPDKQFYYCFGCGEHGNAINFVMKQQGIPFTEAIRVIAQTAGLTVPESPQSIAAQQKKAKSKHLIDVMKFAESFFRTQLNNTAVNREVAAYMRTRNLMANTVETFKLGYAPTGWDSLIKALDRANIHLSAANEAGLVIQKPPNKQYDRFRDRLIFPIHSRRGDVIGFGGRALNNEDKPKYLNSPETPLFQKNRELYGLHQITQAKAAVTRIVVVEGYLDVLMLWQNQIQYAVATLGTSTGSSHLEALFKIVDEVIFCFDGDDAGNKAAFRALEAAIPLMRDGREVRFLFLPAGEDPDTIVQKEGRAQFELRINNAQPLPDYLCDTIIGTLDLSHIEHRSRFVRDIAPHLGQLPSGVYRELVINKVAELTRLDRGLVLTHIESRYSPNSSTLSSPANASTVTSSPATSSPITKKTPSLPAASERPLDTEAPFPAGNVTAEDGYARNQGQLGTRHTYRPASSKNPPPSLVDKTIALLLHKPNLALEIKTPEALSHLKLDNIELLIEVIQASQKEPLGSSAYLFGRWHGSPLGEQLAKIAAQELFVDQNEEAYSYKDSYQDSLTKLSLAYIEQQLEEVLSGPTPDPALIQELLEKKTSLIDQTEKSI